MAKCYSGNSVKIFLCYIVVEIGSCSEDGERNDGKPKTSVDFGFDIFDIGSSYATKLAYVAQTCLKLKVILPISLLNVGRCGPPCLLRCIFYHYLPTSPG